ncbi:MAG: feoB 1 [Proteobacteria bacterium]|nr:feoB 1 [Pseudomonadota bacterium]
MHEIEIALLGNPNCGKTTVFNALTGARQRVGNWPGVTVEKKIGRFNRHGRTINVVDLPGTYALEHEIHGLSDDERIARDYAMAGEADLIVNVIDASNLQRNLYLTFQLLDLGRPMLVVLNMMDSVEDRGEEIDIPALQTALGCPVIGIAASRNRGIAELKDVIFHAAEKPVPPIGTQTLPAAHATALSALSAASENLAGQSRWHLLGLVQNGDSDKALNDKEISALQNLQQSWGSSFDGEIDIAIASARYEAIDALCKGVFSRPLEAGEALTSKLDRIALHRIWGIPVFLGAMYLMFLLSINVGSAFIDFFDVLAGTLFVEGATEVLSQIGTPEWLTVFIANGIGGGIQTVSTFIPVIAAMFLCLSFLEDSGYLARAAMVTDRAMNKLGLPGKAFVPMLVGFGCNVPAIMGTRTLDSVRDRLQAVMMIPFMSCGARLPVYALFAAAFFPTNGQNVVFALYLAGIIVASATGLILKHTLLPGKSTPFVMELPPYRMPTLKGLLLRSWDRLKVFILNAGKIIVGVVMVLNILNSLGTDGSFGNENTEKSVLTSVSQHVSVVFEPMGVSRENWPATVGIFTGIFAKEAVVGTLDSLYTSIAAKDNKEEEEKEPYSLPGGIQKAWETIPENLGKLGDSLADPLGINLGDVEAAEAAGDEINKDNFAVMRQLFGSTAAAIAYLLFVLLYIPCVAALGAVYRETGSRWTLLVAGWAFAMAWGSGTLWYQAAQLGTSPLSAGSWIVSLVLAAALGIVLLRRAGQRAGEIRASAPAQEKACASGSCCQ